MTVALLLRGNRAGEVGEDLAGAHDQVGDLGLGQGRVLGFDEVISPTGAQAPAWHPLGTADEAGAQTANAQQASEPEEADPAEAALDAATTRVEAAPASVPQASPEPRTETAMRGIPVVGAEDPALAEPEVSDLVVRARKILSDLPGSIAPQE